MAVGQNHADTISFFVFILDKLEKSKTQSAFMLQRLSFQTFIFFFRFLCNEPLTVFESDLVIVSFRVW